MTIKQIREGKHLTQQQVADAVGITSTAYARIERGEAKLEDCKYGTVQKLISVLGYEILGGIGMNKKEVKNIRYNSGDPFMFPEVSGKITVRWEANWMMCVIHAIDDTGYDEIELYSEISDNIDDEENARFIDDNGEFDINAFDEYAYPILKQNIIEQAEKNGIPEKALKFHWD